MPLVRLGSQRVGRVGHRSGGAGPGWFRRDSVCRRPAIRRVPRRGLIPRAGGAAGLGNTPTTSVRRLTSLFNRSSGLVDQIFLQCGTGKSANAVMSSAAPRSIVSIFGSWRPSMPAMVSRCSRTGWAKMVRTAGDHLRGSLRDLGEHVAQIARGIFATPRRSGWPRSRRADRCGHQRSPAAPGQAARFQGPQKRRPKRAVLAVTDVEAEDFAASVGGHPGGDHHRLGHPGD